MNGKRAVWAFVLYTCLAGLSTTQMIFVSFTSGDGFCLVSHGGRIRADRYSGVLLGNLFFSGLLFLALYLPFRAACIVYVCYVPLYVLNLLFADAVEVACPRASLLWILFVAILCITGLILATIVYHTVETCLRKMPAPPLHVDSLPTKV